jgi:hypothetical protein
MGTLPAGLKAFQAKKKAGQLGKPVVTPAMPPFQQPNSLQYGGVNGTSLTVVEPTGKKVNLKKALKKHGPKKGKTT